MSKPPPKGDFWRAFAAVTILPINGSQKAVLGCLIDHANPKNGLCYPSEALIAPETAIPIRTVERAVADLLRTPYLSRTSRPQSSNTDNINFDALLKDWGDYKARGAAYRVAVQEAVTEAVTVTEPSPMTKSHPSRVADQPVKCGGSTPSRAADKQKKGTEKVEKKSRMASPLRGDVVSDASIVAPAGEVSNVGGLLARFERTFKQSPNSIPDLKEWQDWLEQVRNAGNFDDPNAQRAARLVDDVDYYLDNAA